MWYLGTVFSTEVQCCGSPFWCYGAQKGASWRGGLEIWLFGGVKVDEIASILFWGPLTPPDSPLTPPGVKSAHTPKASRHAKNIGPACVCRGSCKVVWHKKENKSAREQNSNETPARYGDTRNSTVHFNDNMGDPKFQGCHWRTSILRGMQSVLPSTSEQWRRHCSHFQLVAGSSSLLCVQTAATLRVAVTIVDVETRPDCWLEALILFALCLYLVWSCKWSP